MKALTIKQPYASLVIRGIKWIETRSWAAPQSLIGQELYIHAAKEWYPGWLKWIDPDGSDGWKLEAIDNVGGESTEDCNGSCYYKPWKYGLPLGVILGTVVLYDCVPMITDDEMRPEEGEYVVLDGYGKARLGPHLNDLSDQVPYGDFRSGNFAWMLGEPARFRRPIPAKGKQGLWNWEPQEVAA